MKDGFVAGDNGLYLDWFRTKDGDTGFQYDLEKCEVTLLKDSCRILFIITGMQFQIHTEIVI